MQNNDNKIAYWLAVWFGAGLLPKAPGTWGSFVGAFLGGAIILNFDIQIMLIFIITLYFIGVWASDCHQAATGKHDLGEVVIDEVVGQWIALLPLYYVAINNNIWIDTFICFCLFRVFDILKPWPIGLLDAKIKGGKGVMIDDVAAGIMASGAFLILDYFL